MLVLSRRSGTSIIIDHSITVTVEIVSEADVCLAVDAPEGTSIERAEELDMAKQLESKGRAWDPDRHRVLSSRPRPTIVVAGIIRIAILSVSSDVARIGLDAPAHIEVHREEVYREILEANRQAAESGEGDLASLAGLLGGPKP